MDKNCSSSCHFFFCFVLKSNNNKWAFAGSHTKKTHFTMITHKSWGLHYSPALMICAIRGSLCVVQIVIKKPSKEICDLKRVFYPQHMTDVTVISYLLPANLSAQQARGRQKGFFFSPEEQVLALVNRWQCATTESWPPEQWVCQNSSLGRGRLEAVPRI